MRKANRQQPSLDELKNLEASPLGSQDGVAQWHKDILDERQRGFEEGKIKALDWEEAKRQIEKAIR